LAVLWFLAALGLNLLGDGASALWDRDEPRFAEATREMIAGGDWAVPHFNGELRPDKPVLIYWLMSVPMRLFGVNAFSARCVSALAGAVTVALVFLLAVRLGCNLGGASVAALIPLLCAQMVVISKSATTDAFLILTVVGALFLHWEQRQLGFRWSRHLLFWAVLGLSLLTKGPPGAAVVTLAVVCDHLWEVMSRRVGLRSLIPGFRTVGRTAIGLGLMLALCLPWAWLAWERTGGEFFRLAVGRHLVERSLRALEGHRGPIFYYLITLPIGLFPFAAVALLGMRHAATARTVPAARFLWSWLVPGLLMFSVVRTKLPHYVAPLIPAVALMAGLWWTSLGETTEAALAPGRLWWRAGAVFTGLTGGAVGVGLVVFAIQLRVAHALAPAVLIALILAASSFAGGFHWWLRSPLPAVRVWLAGMVVVLTLVLLWLLPSLDPLRPSTAVVAWLRTNAPPDTALAAARYREPSLVFQWGRPVEFVESGDAGEGLTFLRDRRRPAALVTTASAWEDWSRDHAADLPPWIRVLHEERCLQVTHGRWVDLVIVGNW
jgi:4-amino-4-deoxy-L-arabinose transferase-like glycosyltransferase